MRIGEIPRINVAFFTNKRTTNVFLEKCFLLGRMIASNKIRAIKSFLRNRFIKIQFEKILPKWNYFIVNETFLHSLYINMAFL